MYHDAIYEPMTSDRKRMKKPDRRTLDFDMYCPNVTVVRAISELSGYIEWYHQ